MTKKLKILGPYTPEHPGPFCTRDGRPARVLCTDCAGGWPVVALIAEGEKELARRFGNDGSYIWGAISNGDLMNAEEVPAVQEFWVNEYTHAVGKIHFTEESAKEWGVGPSFIRTIHVREVLPGDGE